jgi:phosphate-selective porin OprO/OprP
MQPPSAPTPLFDQFMTYPTGTDRDVEQPPSPPASALRTAEPGRPQSPEVRPLRLTLPAPATQVARRTPPASSVPPLTLPASSAPPASSLPASPAQHFAETADEMFVPNAPAQRAMVSAQLASYQPSLSESGGEDALNSLNRRVKALEDQKDKGGQKQKRDPNAPGAGAGFEHNLFGRIQGDTVTIGQNPGNIKQVGHAPNGTDFRRARLGMQGTGYDVYFYRFEVDFSNPDQVAPLVPRITDAYVEIRQLPFGTLRMGEFRVPLSTERLMSANDLTFIERGLPQTFSPARQLGIMLFNSTENYLASYYTDISTFQATDEGEQFGKAGRFDFTQRLVFLPWYDEPSDGRYLFFFGGAFNYQNARNNTVKYSTTPEAVLQYFTTKNEIPSFISTGSINARDVQIAQVEASTVLGPLSIQGEYYGTWVTPTASGTPYFFHGAYVFASYFLTGEHRVYSRDQGYYTSVTPFTNFFRVRGSDGRVVQGSGAWEIAARFSTMNLSDRSIQGGRLNDFTLGVNWYLTRQLKVMANYIYAMNNVNNKQTYADIFETRCQVVW